MFTHMYTYILLIAVAGWLHLLQLLEDRHGRDAGAGGRPFFEHEYIYIYITINTYIYIYI